MIDLKKLAADDPLKRMVEKESGQTEYSPMSPPDAYSPPAMEPLDHARLPAFLQRLVQEHQQLTAELLAFEEILRQLHQEGLLPSAAVNAGLKRFFSFLDEQVVAHHQTEEKLFFPALQQRLLAAGEHSRGAAPKTAVDMLEDDHIKVMQLAALCFNFLGLAARLPDAASRALTLDTALEQGKGLIELLRLHMFREENVLFPMAVKYLTEEAFRGMDDCQNPAGRS